MAHSGCNCGKCHEVCKPTDEQIERSMEHMIIVRDVVDAIDSIGEPIAKWGFLGNHLVMRGVFE